MGRCADLLEHTCTWIWIEIWERHSTNISEAESQSRNDKSITGSVKEQYQEQQYTWPVPPRIRRNADNVKQSTRKTSWESPPRGHWSSTRRRNNRQALAPERQNATTLQMFHRGTQQPKVEHVHRNRLVRQISASQLKEIFQFASCALQRALAISVKAFWKSFTFPMSTKLWCSRLYTVTIPKMDRSCILW